MNEMLDSQLSAMFDDELPPVECELMARRLSRDEALRQRWRHYAVMGAVIRGERGVALEVDLTQRIAVAMAAEPTMAVPTLQEKGLRGLALRRLWQGVAGASVAAGVATVSLMWLRGQAPAPELALAHPPGTAPVSAARAAPEVPGADSYTVPASMESRAVVPPTELANYVVAHSEFSTPLSRRNLLSSLVAADATPEETPVSLHAP